MSAVDFFDDGKDLKLEAAGAVKEIETN